MTTEAPPGTDVITKAHSQLPDVAREKWTPDDLRTIAATVCQGLTVAELKMVLSIGAKYDLDPLLREIWGAKGKDKDGKPGQLLIMVGRDGLLRNARRTDGWRGFDSDVVHANDTFKVSRTGDGKRAITHEYEGDVKARGDIVGAWAQVYQDGKVDTYFYAPWGEYAPKNYNKAWTNTPSVMIQKCALSLCLRLAFNLSGVVGEEEAARAFEDDAGVPTPEESLAVVMASVPHDLRDRLYAAYSDAANVRPGLLSPAAIQMHVGGQTPEKIGEYIAEVEAMNAAARQDHEAEGPAIDDVELVGEEEPLRGDRMEVTPEGMRTASVDLDALRHRLSDLYDQREGLGPDDDPGPVDDEIALVEENILKSGGKLPGQEAML